jgi:aryl-alcohol dehydrogenase-like predicted oxidoreductase
VSEIAFGGWELGGDWGPVDDAESIKTLHHAYERGINFVDTAELCGSGHSEEVIGESLRQWRGDKIYVATKVQPTVWPDPGRRPPQCVADTSPGTCVPRSTPHCAASGSSVSTYSSSTAAASMP